MNELSLTVLLALCLAALVAFKTLFTNYSRRRLSLPPGPKPFPIVGNLLQFPKELPWQKFRQWGLEYGDVVYLRAATRHVLLLNSHQAALDLLEQKSAIFSSKPRVVFASDMCGFGKALVLTPYNARMRTARKYFHSLMSPHHTSQYWRLEETAARQLVRRIYDDIANGDERGERLFQRIKWTTASVALLIACKIPAYQFVVLSHKMFLDGYKPAKLNDPLIRMESATSSYFEQATAPGAWLVNSIPALLTEAAVKCLPTWLPFVSFPRIAAKWRRETEEVVNYPFEMVRAQMATHSAPPSFVRKILETEGSPPTAEDLDCLKWTASDIFSAGTETTASAIYAFFLAMILFPDVQARAQRALSSVTGDERMPNFTDRQNEKLAYIDALVKEILRWAPIAPLGVVHSNTSEHAYRSWTIPKHTTVIVNVWGIFRDSSTYPQPEEFRPERFLMTVQGGDCKSLEDLPLDPRAVVFGYGRRNCPGQHLADLALWIEVATILAVYNISRAPGEEASPSAQFTSGVVSHPKPFRCSILPRSEKVQQFILDFDESATAYMADVECSDSV
ncbi:cytochrome P450 [Sistotremastrum niveocremeum HHB9708]|uniref:Cytochrome P450 n=1 Tax=Sistotremastrum niveocremeum HHB9708 TaxID=1314777 RepID=A0A164PNP1_9AGAM|nr:cytochrome P450 [Sistotremastrum niveocremeum HHB9708]